jgi:hypothetical protein
LRRIVDRLHASAAHTEPAGAHRDAGSRRSI